MPDIDIDFYDRNQILNVIKHIPATIKEKNEFKKHKTGVYVQEIPRNPFLNASSIEYKEAEERGYFKIDFLNVHLYKDVRNEQHLIELMNKEPLWELLEKDEFVDLLFHINGYGNLLRKLKPKSIEQLAAVLAMIRPAKKHLVNENWDVILKEVWIKPDSNEYYFKKSHSISYATAIAVQMNLICEQLENV